MKFKPIYTTLKNETFVTIREAVVRDAEALIETGILYLQESPYFISTLYEFNFTIPQERHWIKSCNKSNNSLLLVATQQNKIIGRIDLQGENRKKIKHNVTMGIAILKKWQHIGLGTALIHAAVQWAKIHSFIKAMWLNVHAMNKEAIALYKKMGFDIDGIQKDFINELDGGFSDNIIMGLKIK